MAKKKVTRKATKKAAPKKKAAGKKAPKKKSATVRKESAPALFEKDVPVPDDLKRLALKYCDADSEHNRAKTRRDQAKLLCIESMKNHGFTQLILPDANVVLEATVTDGLRRRKPKKKKDD